MIYESGSIPSDEDLLGLRTQRNDPQEYPRGSMALQKIEIKCKPRGGESRAY